MSDYRPAYHLAPASGWLNDPNGLVYHDGEYHLFYQWCPDVNVDTMFMYWAHAVSSDLAHWQHLPAALEPDPLGSIWSGSAVVDARNTSGFFGKNGGLVAIFTHHNKDNAERQSLAFSADRGRTWTKHSGNPVLGGDDAREFRDPKVFWHEPSGQWIMIVGVRQRIYGSPNLREWKHLSDTGFCSECPDLFPVSVENSDQKKWLLSLGGRQYCVGSFDGRKFTIESGPGEVDGGPDFYATQSWNDAPGGRPIWIGWINAWRYSRDVPAFGARGYMSIPRELFLRGVWEGNLKLQQRPVPELAALRQETIALSAPTVGKTLFSADTFELEASWSADEWDRCGFKIRSSKNEETVVGYDAVTGCAFINRERSGLPLMRGQFQTPLNVQKKKLSMRVFVDRSSVEAFFNDGAAVISTQIYPSEGSTGVSAFSENGKSGLESASAWRL